MDRDRLLMDKKRWMTADGTQEMHHGRPMKINLIFFNEGIEVMRSYTILWITQFDFKLQCCNREQTCRYMMFCWRYGSSEYDTDHYLEHYSEIPNYAATCQRFNAKYDPESDPESKLQS